MLFLQLKPDILKSFRNIKIPSICQAQTDSYFCVKKMSNDLFNFPSEEFLPNDVVNIEPSDIEKVH